LAEQDMSLRPLTDLGVPIAPEILVPRIGDYLQERGLVTADDIQAALDLQKERAASGQQLLLGQALLELGVINRETLDSVITMQILHLQNALNDSNRQLEKRVQDRTADLQRALERLAELNQLKSNFIANISHELRTPLTHLKGYLDILVDEGLGPLNSSQLEALSVLQRAESRLEQLIEDLIQFSLASRGELNLDLQIHRIERVVENAIERIGYKARAGGVSIQATLPDDLPGVRIDEEKIGWVLIQLLDNAVKFTPKGGWVTVDAHQEGAVVTLSVADTGIGIPEDRKEEIFEPFHQLDSSTSRRYGGTGLGLAMVQSIIEAHDSKIKVFSEVGQGSRFEFSLPAAAGSRFS